ncbi:unnamed protein product [Ilex paraguariensis]|uniref:Uncharacterized protein n=1 Tax=Ilex paraguariensis TaxID=185542 RepID=A0ABC8UKW7_9AQUA
MSHLVSELHKTSITKASVEELIFGVTFVTAFGLLQLPYQKIDGNPVPTIIFKDNPSSFHAFLLAINFAFTGAVLTVSLRARYPKIARYCRQLAVVCVTAAAVEVMGPYGNMDLELLSTLHTI